MLLVSNLAQSTACIYPGLGFVNRKLAVKTGEIHEDLNRRGRQK
jgi:hypothetical protein